MEKKQDTFYVSNQRRRPASTGPPAPPPENYRAACADCTDKASDSFPFLLLNAAGYT